MKASVGNRVLMLLENNPYPQDARVRRQCQALLAAGYKVSVVCQDDPGQPRRERVDGVSVYRYPAPPEPRGIWGYVWEYFYSLVAMSLVTLEVAFREGFDILHAANPPDTLFLVAAPYKPFGRKFVFDHHDLSPELFDARYGNRSKRWMHAILVLLEKLSCRLADLVIATNESYKQVEMERGKVPADRIAIVRNGPERDRFRPSADSSTGPKDRSVIAYAGMMGYQDGLDYLLRALRHLVYDMGRRDFSCVLIGGRGDARRSLAELCTKLELDDFVTFTGWVSDEEYARLVASADICVDPDPSNPFNDRSSMNKMVEYMASGKPIVAFSLPEHRFTAQEAAVYVSDNDEKQFAREIAALMDDPERRQRMGAFGRNRFETQLSWENSVELMLAAYATLAPPKPFPQEADALQESSPRSVSR